MKNKLKRILLIDDSAADNFVHKRNIKKADVAEDVIVKNNGREALDYLNTILEDDSYPAPELIFLDINMPVINGWEFLVEYDKLMDERKASIVLAMLTTSKSPKDLERAKDFPFLSDLTEKPLTVKLLMNIVRRHFPGRLDDAAEEG